MGIKHRYLLYLMTGYKIVLDEEMKGDEAVSTEPLSLVYVPDRFKTQKLCSGVVCNKP